MYKHNRTMPLQTRDPTNELIIPKFAPSDRMPEFFKSKHVKVPTRTKFLHKQPANIRLELYKRRSELEYAEFILKHVMLTQKELREEMDADWDNLMNKEIEFRNNILFFNKFVNENHDKRERAIRKIQEESQIYKQRCADIQKLKTKMDAMHSMKQKLEERIKQYGFYQNFLEEVATLANTNLLKTPRQIMVRYDTLIKLKEEILMKQKARQEEMDDFKQRMTQIVEQKRIKLLHLSVIANDLMRTWDVNTRRALQWENILSAIKEDIVLKYSKIECIKHAADNLYLLVCERKRVTPDPARSFDDKISDIKNNMQHLAIVQKLQNRKSMRKAVLQFSDKRIKNYI